MVYDILLRVPVDQSAILAINIKYFAIKYVRDIICLIFQLFPHLPALVL